MAPRGEFISKWKRPSIFVERATSSLAFVLIRRVDDGLALGIGVEASGDLDLVVSLTTTLAISPWPSSRPLNLRPDPAVPALEILS